MTVPYMPKSQGSRLHREGSSQRDLREPFRFMITSAQVDLSRVLLAYHAEGCQSLCQSLRQVLEVQQHHQTTNRRANSDGSSMALYSMGVRHHEPIPNGSKTIEVPSGRYRLLYQMGKS